MYQRLRIVAFL